MTQTTSLNNKRGLFRILMKKNRTLMIYLSVLLFFFFPFQYLQETASTGYFDETTELYLLAPSYIYSLFSIVMVVLIVSIAALVISLTQFSYMHQKRAVDVYHSLPITRSKLLAYNALTAALTVWLPLFTNYLLVLVLALCKKSAFPMVPDFAAFTFLGWAKDLFIMTVFLLTVVAVACLVAPMVSSFFDNLLFFGLIYFSLPVLYSLIFVVCKEFILGFSNNIYSEILALSLCPFTSLIGHYVYADDGFSIGLVLWILWLLIAVLAFFLAQKAYGKRKSEMAESVGTGNVLTWFGKLFAAFLGAVFFGFITTEFTRNYTGITFILGATVGVILTMLLMELILSRGFAGTGKKLCKDIPAGLCIVLFFAILILTGFGFVNSIPAVDEIQSVSLSYRGKYDSAICYDVSTEKTAGIVHDTNIQSPIYSYENKTGVLLTDKKVISDIILPLHQSLIDSGKNRDDTEWCNLDFTYTLTNGKTMSRSYSLCNDETIQLLLNLENEPAFYTQTCPLESLTGGDLTRISVSGCTGLSIDTVDDFTSMNRILEALRTDIANDEDQTLSGEILATLTFDTAYNYSEKLEKDAWGDFTFCVPSEYTETLAVLSEITGKPFEPDYTAVSKVILSDYEGCYNTYANGHRFVNETPVAYPSYDEEYYSDCSLTVTDPEKIAELIAVFRETPADFDLWLGNYAFLRLSNADNYGAVLIAPYESLPQWAIAEWEAVKTLY